MGALICECLLSSGYLYLEYILRPASIDSAVIHRCLNSRARVVELCAQVTGANPNSFDAPRPDSPLLGDQGKSTATPPSHYPEQAFSGSLCACRSSAFCSIQVSAQPYHLYTRQLIVFLADDIPFSCLFVADRANSARLTSLRPCRKHSLNHVNRFSQGRGGNPRELAQDQRLSASG